MPSEPAARLSDAEVARVLTDGSLALEGRLIGASNASFFGQVTLDGASLPCVYKPIAGERPLWDFPDGQLAHREVAAWLVSEAAGWRVVPPTVLRAEARFGPGMVQQWIEESAEHALVDVIPEDEDRPGWIAVLEAEDQTGSPVLLVHADHPRLRDLAVFDVVVNNADRKGGHVLVEYDDAREAPTGAPGHLEVQRLWGCDHGVSFHVHNKLRTVLWGWAKEPLREQDLAALDRLDVALEESLSRDLGALLTDAEIEAMTTRVAVLRKAGRMPVPEASWPAIPWPAF